MKKGQIKEVLENSIAEELELNVGDTVISINNNNLGDIIDYVIATSDDYLELEVEKTNGEVYIYEIEKCFNEDLGIFFDPPTIEPIMSCQNNCKFCFINQMPPNMRNTLYVKDDDYRLSFLLGNYITGTNLKNEDIERIISYNLSPLYISVHQTGKGRDELLGRKMEFSIMDFLLKLKKGNISFHTQIVVVPGFNDGEVLKKTLKDLHLLKPNILSIAVVPVGLTKYRDNLEKLKPLTKETAKDIISISNSFLVEDNIVFLSDEIYTKAQQSMPKEEYYQGYLQLENGIGMLRLFIDEFSNALNSYNDIISEKAFDKKYVVLTGTLVAGYIDKLLDGLSKLNSSFKYEILPIENDFFGSTVSVAGLLVGRDIIKALDKLPDDNANVFVILPRNSLNYDKEVFLDDTRIDDVIKRYNFPIHVTEVDGRDFLLTILDEEVN